MKIGRVAVSEQPPPAAAEDIQGEGIEAILASAFGEPIEWARVAVAADEGSIEEALRRLVDIEECPLVVTTGGIGPAEHAITPDATRAVVMRELPGLAEAMRACTSRLSPDALLSRAVAGIRANSLILNLPVRPELVAAIAARLAPAIAECIGQVASCQPMLKPSVGGEGIEPTTYWV